MRDAALLAVRRFLHCLAAAPEVQSDGEMLRRYLQNGDAASFARLVERHSCRLQIIAALQREETG